MSETYFIGYGVHQYLLTWGTLKERASLRRLADGEGDADDLRAAAGIYTRRGDPTFAADLLRVLPPLDTPPVGG